MKVITTVQLKKAPIGTVYAPWDNDLEQALLQLRVRDGSSEEFNYYRPISTVYSIVPDDIADDDAAIDAYDKMIVEKLNSGDEIKLHDVAFADSVGFDYEEDEARYLVFNSDDLEVLKIDINEFLLAAFQTSIVSRGDHESS